MNPWFYLIPIISAILGWCLNWLAIQLFFMKLLPSKQPEIAARIGSAAGAGFFSFSDMEARIADGEALKKIMPTIENHIDEFLRHKLSKAMPVIGMFIGDKTINQLKGIFMKELEEIFPATIKNYLNNLQDEIDIAKIVAEKIATIPPAKLEVAIKNAIPSELRLFKIYGAL
ncbi:MAG TPA: hypothetical protein VIY47_11880, partial [Ignavibacteriaceae bacterium]